MDENKEEFSKFLDFFIQERLFKNRSMSDLYPEVVKTIKNNLNTNQFEILMFHDFLIDAYPSLMTGSMKGDLNSISVIEKMLVSWAKRAYYHKQMANKSIEFELSMN